MHFYDFNIGDYAKKTQHLTNEEDLAYRRLLDLYYDTEKPVLSGGLATLSRRLRVDQQALENVLNEFFPDGKNKHADEKITAYYAYIEKQKANGKQGGRPKHKPTANPKEPSAKPSLPTTHYPLPTTQEPSKSPVVIPSTKDLKIVAKKEKTARASRLPPDWILPKPYGDWALKEKPLLAADDIRKIAENFKDHWISTGKNAAKLDWFAAWRLWVRKEPDAPRKNVILTAQQQRDVNNKKSSDDFVNGNVSNLGRVIDHA